MRNGGSGGEYEAQFMAQMLHLKISAETMHSSPLQSTARPVQFRKAATHLQLIANTTLWEGTTTKLQNINTPHLL